MLAQRVGEPVEKHAWLLEALLRRSRVRLGDEVVAASRNVFLRRLLEVECKSLLIEACVAMKHKTRERPEPLAKTIHLGCRVFELESQSVVDVLVKVLKQQLPRVVHPRTNTFIHLFLERAERRVNICRCTTLQVDREDPGLEIHARLDCPEYLVRRSEHTVEETELLTQELQH